MHIMLSKKNCIFLLVIFSIVLQIVLFAGCKRNQLSKNNVQLYFSEYKQEHDSEKRVQIIENLLSYLKKTDSVDDDVIVRYTMGKLTTYFILTEDMAILDAVDKMPIYAGFANFICDFYSSIKETKGFQKRYNNNDLKKHAIERCVGISFK